MPTRLPHSSGTLCVLIVRTGAMGDILHALPAVTAWHERFPHAHLGWAVEPHWRPMLEPGMQASSLVNTLHLVPTREWKRRPLSPSSLRTIFSLGSELRAAQYDVAVDLQGSIRSAVLCRLSGAARILGSDGPREPQARTLYRETIHLHTPDVISQACELMAAIDGKPLSPNAVDLPRDEAAEAWFNQTFPDPSPSSSRPLVLLVPTAGWGAKRWPVPHFRDLAAGLTSAGCRVLVNALSSDDPVAFAVANGTGATPVSCSIAQLIALTRRAALVVGGDTGPIHLAAALRRPVLALFGPTDPERNGPWFPGAQPEVLRSPLSRTDHRRLEKTDPGLQSIAPGHVLELALRMLAKELNG